MSAQPDKLVDGHYAANDHPILDCDMPGKIDRISQNYMATDPAIVGNMSIRHDQTITTDDRFSTVLRPATESGEFTDDRAVADKKFGLFAREFQVLGLAAHRRAMKDAAIPAEARPGTETDMRVDDCPVANGHITFDYCVWTHRDLLTQLRIRGNDR